MRVGMISQWYEPEPGAAAHPTAIAEALQRRGHQVRVLTGFPNYPTGQVYPEYDMTWRQREWIRGVELVRVPLFPSHDASGAKRALALGSFAASAAMQVMSLRDADVCLVYLTPATVGFAARVLRRMTGIPYVLYVQDLWPDSVTGSGFITNPRIQNLVERGINLFCSGLYRSAHSVVAISPTMAELLLSRGVSAEQSELIYNWVDESVFQPLDLVVPVARSELDQDSVWIMYAGGIGDLQGLEHAVAALSLLRDQPHIKLALVGDGVAVASIAAAAKQLNVEERVRLLGRRPMAEMPRLMAEADAQLISLRDLPMFHGTIPSKLQATMATGLPIVCSVPGDTAGLVIEAGAGLAAAPESAQGLADAFRRLAGLGFEEKRALGKAGREFYERRLAEDVGADELEELLAAAASHRGER